MKERKILLLGPQKLLNKKVISGGQLFACQSLSDHLYHHGYEIISLNTSYRVKKDDNKISLWTKTLTLVKRNFQFLFKILFNPKAKNILIFVSAGNSYIEKAPFIFISKWLGKRTVVFPRSGFLLKDYDKKSYRIVVNAVFRKSDYIICQSEFWKEYFIENKVSKEKLVVIENWYPKNQIEKSTLLTFQESLIKEEEFKMVFVARIEEGKGIDDLISVAELLKQDKLLFSIDIFGEGNYKDSLQKKIIKTGLDKNITLKGWLGGKNKLETINQYHLAIFPSRFEGYPNTLLDYIFSKIPILATDTGSIKAVGQNNMTYYTPGNIVEMREKILDVHGNYVSYVKHAKQIYKIKTVKNHIDHAGIEVINLLR